MQYIAHRFGYGVFNRGVSFGLLSQSGSVLVLVVGAVTTFVLGIFLVLTKNKRYALYLILFGGLANAVNRLMWGGVFDYLRFFGDMFWFNIADFGIFVGVVSYILKIDEEDSNHL